MHIGLLGAAFDPPHTGHKTISEQLLLQQICDEVWYVPARKHPFAKKMSADIHRLKMIQLLLQDQLQDQSEQEPFLLGSIKIEEYELHREEPSYSYNTLQHFSSTFPQHTFSWVIGSDNVPNFHKWYEYENLLRYFQVLVYPRHGYAAEPLHQGMRFLKDFPEIGVSSTQIRQKIAAGESIEVFVTSSVENYIQEQKLYLPEIPETR